MSAAASDDHLSGQPSPLRRAWPVFAGLGAMLAGIALLVASTQLEHRKVAFADRVKHVRAELLLARAAPSRTDSHPIDATLDVPPAAMQLADVEALVRVAEQSGVRVASLQFRSEAIPRTPYLLRTAEFRVEEDYPRMRAFVAELLARVPHLYLDELRADQTAAADGKVQANLRMSFVYLAAGSRP